MTERAATGTDFARIEVRDGFRDQVGLVCGDLIFGWLATGHGWLRCGVALGQLILPSRYLRGLLVPKIMRDAATELTRLSGMGAGPRLRGWWRRLFNR